jgi:hypothetical protein
MPLAFESLDHGTVAFGFFNIDTDMLLLEHYFFFAPDFCEIVEQLARPGEQRPATPAMAAFHIPDPADIGDLMGAIHGIRHTGFIGELYLRFPFPRDPAAFKQKPEGRKNRACTRDLIQKYAQLISLSVKTDPEAGQAHFNEYGFTREVFHELLDYVWRGGYPKWRDGVRPDYVTAMKIAVEKSDDPLLRGMVFNN